MCGIACGGEIKRTRSVSLRPDFLSSSICSILPFSLSYSSSSPSSSSRGFSLPLSVAPELWQTRYQFLTFARAFSLLLHLSFLLDDNVEPTPVLSRLVSRPLPSALFFCPTRRGAAGRRRRRDSIIIADSLISINCRARGFPMDSARLKLPFNPF